MSTITTESNSTSLIKVEEITTTMATASDVLARNENLVTLCANKGQTFLDTIEGGEMSDDLDAALNDWQVKAKQALGIMNTRRAPVTQLMTKMAKLFTSLEAKIDPDKADSVYAKIQKIRNEYAKKKAADQKAKEAKILLQQNIDKEKIELKANVETIIRQAFQNKVFEFKTFYTNKLNAAILTTLDDVVKQLKAIKLIYPRDKFYELPINITSIYIEKTELAGFIFGIRESLYDELAASFRENMESHQQSLLDQVPSKKRELEAIAKAGAAKKKELEEAANQRTFNDQQKLQEQADLAIKQDAQKVEMNKNIEASSTLFSATAQLAELKGDSTGKVRQGYKINVLDVAGYGAIFMFYFEKEGMNLTVDEFGKKTMAQMKAFCEKHAHKTNEKLVHPSIEFEEDFKAVATKA